MNKNIWIWVVVVIIVGVGAFFLGKSTGGEGAASLYNAKIIDKGGTPSTWSYCGTNGQGGGYYLSTSGTCWEANTSGANAVPGGLCGGCATKAGQPINTGTSSTIKASTPIPTTTTSTTKTQ